MPWSRRIGIALAMLVVGGSIVLAGSGALEGGRPNGSPGAASPPAAAASLAPASSVEPAGRADGPAPPVLDPPDAAVTRLATTTVRGTVPRGMAGRRDVRVRVLVDGRQVKQARLGRGNRGAFAITGVPLHEGLNEITATVRVPNGESDRSEPVGVTLDTVPPAVTVTEPAAGALVVTETATIAGTSEAGSSVVGTNGANLRTASTTADAAGRFRLTLPVAMGQNGVDLTVTDRAGNTATTTLSLVRGNGEPKLRLQLSQRVFGISSLPAELTLRLQVTDATGLPADGATVTFSISPSGQPTSTLQAVTEDGLASWSTDLPRDDAAPGDGFATAMVTLPSGRVLQETVSFVFR